MSGTGTKSAPLGMVRAGLSAWPAEAVRPPRRTGERWSAFAARPKDRLAEGS